MAAVLEIRGERLEGEAVITGAATAVFQGMVGVTAEAMEKDIKRMRKSG